MKNKFSIGSVFIWFLGLLVSLPAGAATTPAASPAPASGNGIVIIYHQDERINVSVVSSTPDIVQLMQAAFALHGAFAVTVASSANYVLHFEKDGENKVTATIEPKIANVQAYSVTVTATSLNDAAYRAGDKVVERLTQKPGFFAGKIAFVSERVNKAPDVYVSDLLGRVVTRLTFDGKNAMLPRWAPDGTKLLYTGYYRKGFPDVISLDATTGKQTPIATFQGTNTGGTFSPDGKSIAMILSTNDGLTELFVGDATGNNVRRLTRDDPSKPVSKASPTWSPDGKQIAFAADYRGGHPLIYQIPAVGGTAKAFPTNISNYCADPAWNPLDPNKVAFMAEVGSQTLIAVYDAAKNSTQVFDTAAGSAPCWLNDGRHLIFTRHVNGMDQIFLMDTATPKPKITQLTKNGASEASWVYVK